MHNIVFGQYFEGIDYLFEVEECLGLLKASLVLLQNLLKSASIAELVDKVEVIDCFEHVVVTDYVWTRLEVAENIYFVDSAFLEFWQLSKLVRFDHLDCHFLFRFQLNGLEHSRVDSGAQLVLQRVVFDYLSH